MMLSLYRMLGLRYLIHRWDRAGLIVASIALGVATLVSSRILNQCLETAVTETATPMGGGDLYVSNGELGVHRSVVDEIRAAEVPGVQAVRPLVYERVALPGQDTKAVLLGFELNSQMLATENKSLGMKVEMTRDGLRLQLLPILVAIEKGQWAEAGELWRRLPDTLVLVSRPIYDDHKARGSAGRPIVVQMGNRRENCLIVGVMDIDDSAPKAALGRNVIGMELGQAIRFARPSPRVDIHAAVVGTAGEAVWDQIHPPRVNRIDVTITPGANKTTTQQSVQEVVVERASVHTPEAQNRSTQEIVNGMQVGFTLCSAGAMIVGLFLVYNALAVTVAERRHDIGILRSLGATRSQIIGVFASMAIALGLVGAAVGVPLGILMARGATYAFQEELGSIFLNPNSDPVWPTAWTVLLAVIAGVATATFAALLPAIQAATQDPADAVRRVPGVAGGVWKIAHRVTCATLIAGGLVLIVTRHELPPRVGAFGGMMAALVGMLLAAPIFVGLLVRLLHPLLRRVLPIEARLAADNLIRSPGRTGVVIGALGAGVAVMIQTAGVGRSNEEPVVAWIDEVIQADRFVFSGNLTEATSSQSPMEPNVPIDLAKQPGVEGVTALRYVRPEYNGTVVFLVAIDSVTYAEHTKKRRTTNHEGLDKLKKLTGQNAVLVSDNFAMKHKVKPGDTITLPGPKGPVQLLILDTIRDYSWSRGTIYIDRAIYAELYQDRKVDVCHVYFKEGEEATGAESVAKYSEDNGLVAKDRTYVRKVFADLIDRLYTLAFLQQIVVGLVAALGVVTSLLISVLQRKRELGLLLAVGATPGQVVRSVLWEAVLMGLFGTFLGLVIGIPMEWYVLSVVMVEESGFVFDLIIPWQHGLGIAAGSVAIATVAGLLPALHAVRMRIPDAIAYE